MVSHQSNGKLWQYWCELFLLNLAKIYEIIEKLCVEVFHSTSPKLLADIIPRLIGLWIDKNYLLINFPFKLSGCHAKNDFMIGHSDIITLRIIQYKWELVPELLTIFETNSWSKILTTVWLFEWCLLQKNPLSWENSNKFPYFRAFWWSVWHGWRRSTARQMHQKTTLRKCWHFYDGRNRILNSTLNRILWKLSKNCSRVSGIVKNSRRCLKLMWNLWRTTVQLTTTHSHSHWNTFGYGILNRLNCNWMLRKCVFTEKILKTIECHTSLLCAGTAKSHQYIVRAEIGFPTDDMWGALTGPIVSRLYIDRNNCWFHHRICCRANALQHDWIFHSRFRALFWQCDQQ